MYFENNFWLQLLKSLIEFSNDMKLEMTILAKAKRKCIFSLWNARWCFDTGRVVMIGFLSRGMTICKHA